MELNFFDAADVPQPRDKIRIEKLESSPYPEGWRVRINIDVTPFQERPSLEIRVKSLTHGREVAELSVIETMHKHMEFTVHVRGLPSPAGEYVTEVDLYYEDRANVQDHQEQTFTIATT
jgi:hypothetical protein